MNLLALPSHNQRKFGVILSYANILISTLLSLFYTPFLLRMLGQGEFGLYSLSASVIGYLAILDLGFGNAIVVFTAKYAEQNRKDDEKKLHATIFTIYIIMSFICLILGSLITIYAGEIFANSMSESEIAKLKFMFTLLTFNLAITFPLSIYSSILVAYENFIFMKLVAIFRTLAFPILVIPALFMGYKSLSLIVALTLINITCLLLDFFYCRKKIAPNISLRNFDKKVLKEVFAYSFFIFLGMIVDQVNWSIDNFILGVVSGSKEVSLYAVAIIINSMFITLSVTISGVMLPKISKMVSANSTNEELMNEFIKVARIQFYIIFFIASLTLIFGREFINLWAGSEYDKSYIITVILVLPLTVPLIQNLGNAILQAKNMHRFKAIAAFLMTFVNVGVSIPLAQIYGGTGCAIGTALALVILNIFIMNFYYHFKVGLDMIKFWREIFKMTAKFFIPVFIILIFIYFSEFSGLKYLLICGAIYSVIYVFISVKFIMNDYEKSLFGSLLSSLKRRR